MTPRVTRFEPGKALPRRTPAATAATSALAKSALAKSALATMAALAALAAAPDAPAAPRRHAGHAARASEATAPRPAGAPIMAIVSLKHQHVTVYDADGWILRAPVSSGQHGRETPAGVFAVIQKEAEHYSNLYDDASMPHMQRITWSGIALHGGPLPGYAASHGCIRMPYGFAERLFGQTKVGMRVIVAPGDPAPVEIVHPALFAPKPDAAARAAELAAESTRATGKADEARTAAAAAAREAARVAPPLRTLENLKARAEAQLAAAQATLAAATSADAKAAAEDARAKADAKVAELTAQWDAAKAEAQPKLDAAAATREAAAAAEAARTAAAQAAREAARALDPVSVFISRKTQRLYVRRGFEPLFDSPVTIRDPDKPIGTHVFTAMAKSDAGLRWSEVTIDDGDSARDALERITIPPEVLASIAPTALPRSSITISDEGLSKETNYRTEFVVVLNNQPQGGFITRKPTVQVARDTYGDDYYRYGYDRQGGGWGFQYGYQRQPAYDPRQNQQQYYYQRQQQRGWY